MLIMATVAVLPAALRAKIDAVGRHIRLLRLVRGASVLLLTLAVTGGLALLADAVFDLPWAVRAALLAGWTTLAVSLTMFGLIIPLSRRLDSATLAAVVEEKFPEFAERLTTAVELSSDTDDYHGSPAFIALLIAETETRASRLDFLSAVPPRLVWYLGAAALGSLLVVISPAAFAPARYGELAERFFFPWPGSAVGAPFAIDVAPGDTAAAVGRPFTLSAHTRLLREGAALPAVCTLVSDDGQGNIRRDRMTADGADNFSFKFDRLPGSFAYHIEADAVSSPTYHVAGIVPVELAPDSPVITITSPEYALANEPARTINGLNDLRVLQYSRIALEFRFTRPAIAATLHWTPKPADKKLAAEPKAMPLDLSQDRLSARVELPAVVDGTYRICLEAEEGVRTEPDDRALAVVIDKPPRFVKASTPEDVKSVLPHEKVPINLELADDFGIDKAEVEYRVNNGPVAFDPIELWGQGGREAQAQHQFALGGKVKDGDTIAYRIKLQDNRRVPEAGLTPNVTYYPAEGWRSLTISRHAVSLREQEIQAAHDSLNRKLDAIKEDIRKEKRGVYRLQQEARNQDALDAEQAQDLKSLQKDNLAVEDALRDVANEAAEANLQPVADKARDVADKEMHKSAEDLRTAPKQKSAEARSERFDDADQQLASALQKLDDLKKANDEIAQQRLDQMKLEMAAEREKALAERAAELAAKDPVRDRSTKQDSEQLRREQQEAADDLKRMAEQSEPLKNALNQARAEQAKSLADKAKELAEAQRQLAEAQKDTEKKQSGEKLSELAKKQQELADKAAKLAKESKPAARAAKTNPLRPDGAQKAADALKDNNLSDALRNQDKSANELDRVAHDLNRAMDLAKDPREAARQLARLEEDLQKRVAEEAKKPDEKSPLAERLKPLRREQEAIGQAAERLSLPPKKESAQQDRKEAQKHAAEAAEALKKPDTGAARDRMEETKQALNRLADKLPTLAERQQQAGREVAELRRQQQEIGRQAEQAARDAEKKDPSAAKSREETAKKLADAARKESDLADRLGKMDVPNQEARLERAKEALKKAQGDLMDAKTKDINASQEEARRQLDRLQQALNGQKPPDEQARALAQKQRDLADEAKRAAADPNTTPQKQQEMQRKQQQLADETWALPAPEAQQRRAEATEATRKAAEQAKQKPSDADTAKRMDDAAKALERLADKMNGKPSEGAQAARDPAKEKPVEGLPNKQQSEQARQLAREQRELRDAVAKEMAQPEAKGQQNPVGEIAKEQQEIAKQAGELAKDVGKEQGSQSQPAQSAKQAAQSTKEAADKSQAGAMRQAQQSGQQAAQQLRNLAQQMAQTPRGDKADPQAADPVQQARDLAKRQEALNQRMGQATEDTAGQRAQQQARQQDLQRRTGDLTQELNQLAQQMNRAPQAQQAAQSGQQAQHSMQQAQGQQQQGNQGQSHQSQEQAAQALDRASEQARQAGQQMSGQQQGQQAQAGQSLQQAQGQMNQAQQQLGQGRPQGAQQSMQQAAESLQQAAQALAQQQQQQPGKPGQRSNSGPLGKQGGGMPDLSTLNPELKKYAGKRWGDIPGELRTKLIQDMETKFGEDYARRIKLYFEQLAETKK
jgi:hypothetical protein